MKAIKRNYENLKKVCDFITSVPLSLGSFEVDYELPDSNSIRLVSNNRNSIGYSILCMIPSNYHYCVSFDAGCLYLTIWCD